MFSHKLHPGEVSALFQLCNAEFSTGNYEQAATYHDMLNYAFEHHKELVESTLSENKRNRFNQIKQKFDGATKKVERIPKRFNTAENRITDKIVEEEKDLKELLARNHIVLEDAIGCKLEFVGEEVRPTKEERDKCDLIYKDGVKLIVIELKRDQADHASVTQIDKYIKYFWQTAFTRGHEIVEGVVIASRFTNYAYDNLKSNGVKCFQYDLGEKFQLIKI